ncbi:hypothetical protein VSH64_10110 [Amycolatopsis rhabdoformis]|uniref:Nuclear transport factor 2 family protein n=1 Tax=Amycolatopsis rhabdoformis TaxID=1448059 RepID=A0ABZ1IDF9_9PSEU|nr:hypothetical protein [Amycolatopsis rhabdoformis]WSE32457.1 hypothetical protein VSH64_10110 [Amycolatopsis rhabdoformis]
MNPLTRRSALAGLGALTATAVAGTAPAFATPSGIGPVLDLSHATPQLARQVTALFRDKTSRNVARTMSHFARRPMYYTDATLGWYLPTWGSLKAIFDQYMPTWPATARSYATRVLGDERSAIVEFTDSPELFGHEGRVIAALDFTDGLVVRQVDYSDGRHFGIAATNAARVPDAQFPRTFGEDVIPDRSSPALRDVARRLTAALASGDTAGLFTVDATFEDLTLHSTFVGALAIDAYVKRAFRRLPYGPGTTIRHTVGSARGGGYEWINPATPADHGVVALELDSARKISRLTTVWDGSRLSDDAMTVLLSDTLER